MLRRKIDNVLAEWRSRKNHKPLVINGARQVGKSVSVQSFGKANYKNFIEINFALAPKFKSIFDDGYEVDDIIRNISLREPDWQFEPHNTLIFFDELQDCPNCATCLKPFHLDGRYDVICSGSLMGINYKEIDSNAVGFKEDVTMRSLDFEEFLWAHGYGDKCIDELLGHMLSVRPLSETQMEVFHRLFCDFLIVGGMPEIVNMFVQNKNFSGVLMRQRQLLKDYEDDITKYATAADRTKIKAVYKHIPVFLSKENKKFQVSKVAKNARNRDYIGVVEWLNDAGIVNICYCMEVPELPLSGNYRYDNYKLYLHDGGMLIASLDDESQEDLRANKNFHTYKGAIFENAVAESLVKQGYGLYFYKNDKSTIEMDFFVRDKDCLVPVEVKSMTGPSASLRNLVEKDKYSDIAYGIKLSHNNIGFNGMFYTFPYFLSFLIRRFLQLRSQQSPIMADTSE